MPVSVCSIAGPGASSAASPRNLLSTKPRTSDAVLRGQQLERAEEVREGAAAIDVADDQRRRRRGFRHAHVDDVGRLQIDLRGGTRALDHHEVVGSEQLIEAAANRRPQMLRARPPLHAREIIAALTEHDHLGLHVAFPA